MKNQKSITILVVCIIFLSIIASATGIFYTQEGENYQYQSIRDQVITIYGKGLYRHMLADVAIQGIAQDYVTLFIGIPLLIAGLIISRKGSFKGRLFLAGMLNYFFVTYLFYMNMAMYNAMYIVYIILVSASFFAFVLALMGFDVQNISGLFSAKTPVKRIGGFLIFLSSAITLLWLQIIITPLLDGSIIPKEVEHYTTLTVQGFDLSIFLPGAFLGGFLLIKRNPYGYLIGSVTIIFLCLLMTTLVAKIIAMANAGVNVIPVIFIIPAFDILAIISAHSLLKNIKGEEEN